MSLTVLTNGGVSHSVINRMGYARIITFIIIHTPLATIAMVFVSATIAPPPLV